MSALTRSNSRDLARLFYTEMMSEPVSNHESGVYIGRSGIYRLPFYLDTGALVNPHITVVGMSGSGKSYMLKSIVAKSAVLNGARILVIDWNDEYRELMEFVGGRVLSLGSDFKVNIFDLYQGNSEGINGIAALLSAMARIEEGSYPILYEAIAIAVREKRKPNLAALLAGMDARGGGQALLAGRLRQLEGGPLFAESTEFDVAALLDGHYSIDMSQLGDGAQKGELVRFVLRLVIERMHRLRINSGRRRIIVLDEAWRLIRNSDEVGTLFREGRKYGISVIAATQLASDINNEIIANAGCIAVFRLQSEEDYGILANMGLLSSSQRAAIGRLGLGACMLSLAYKGGSSSTSRFFIERINGIELGSLQIDGDGMRTNINYNRFIQATEAMVEPGARERILSYASEHGRSLELGAFIRFLEGLGLGRGGIVAYLRGLGIDDLTIVNSYDKS